MSIGVVIVCFQTYFQFRYIKFRRMSDLVSGNTNETKKLRNDIETWLMVKASILDNGEDNVTLKSEIDLKIDRLKETLDDKSKFGPILPETFNSTLDDLERKYTIRNKTLLIQSGFCLIFVLGAFFLHSIPQLQRLSLGWTALIGALLLLILLDSKDMDSIFGKVEWTTLLFFAGLFIIIEVISYCI